MNENGEIERKVPVNEEDCDNVRNYAINFGVPLSPELEAAMKKFEENQTYENHNEFKLEVCKWLMSSEHESFQDPLWDHPKEAAKDITFDLQFDKDLEAELSDDNEEESE